MGVLQRFERRLEGMVEGAFARVFKGVVEPVEVAAAIQKEAADKKAILGPGRILVPNDYTVELGSSDYARLSPYADPLGTELGVMLQERAVTQGWHFVGPVHVGFVENPQLRTGVFSVSGEVSSGAPRSDRPTPSGPPVPAAGRRGTPRLLVSPAAVSSSRGRPPPDAAVADHPGGSVPNIVPLDRPVTVVGRAADADVRLADTGVSRQHAEIRLEGPDIVIVDVGSTNGTLVNGRRIGRVTLADGDRITVGTTVLTFQQDGP